MMKKIDWYIFKKFMGHFFYAIGILILISVVIDISEKLDDFVNNHLTFSQIVFDYYIGFIPHITALLFPLFVFIAVIFFTSRMAYRSEIVAILSSGISFNRMFRAYWVGAALLGILLAFGNRWVVPRADKVKITFEDKYIHNTDQSSTVTNIHLRIDSISYISMASYNQTYRAGSYFMLEKIRDQDLLYRLESQSVTWDSTQKSWRSGLCYVRTFDGLHETVRQLNDTILKIPLSPDDLLKNANMVGILTTPELNKYIDREKLRGSEGINALYVEKYRRDAAAAAVVILTIIGAVIASRKVRGGSGLHLAIGIVIGAFYVFVLQFSYTFSIKGNLSPLLAVWIPNVIFGGLAYALYRKAPK